MTILEQPFMNWGWGDIARPMIIAGPCSAESEEQIMETAAGLKANGIGILRAGIWKPRTRPNSFEGVGTIGLGWLNRVQKELGMKVSTEVANAKHVEEVLKAGLDMLWIGARTSANPFAMQEIADSLKGVDIPIMVKNPVNPDVDLWIGAVERIMGASITKLGVIHRGFSSFEKSRFRNVPQWQMAIEFRRRMPNIPMVCDPSHISGCTELLHEVSQKALDLNYDGLIIESHCNPAKAWSDAKQQLTPNDLDVMLKSLVLRDVKTTAAQDTSLEELRLQIDKYDDELFRVIGERMKVAEQIGKYKKDNNITILQSSRWNDILNAAIEKGKLQNLSEDFVSVIFMAIHQESINKQTVVMNGKD